MTSQLVYIEDAYNGFPGIKIQNREPADDDVNIVTFFDEDAEQIGIDIYDANTGDLDYSLNCDKRDAELLIEALQRIQRVDIF